MNISKRGWAAAVAFAAATAVAACSAPSTPGADGSGSGSGSSKEGSSKGSKVVTIAETNTFTGHNPSHTDFNVEINSKIKSATTAALYKVTPELKVQHNKEVGSIELVKKEPLTVKYTVNEKIKWSDGNAMDAGDLLLSWAIGSAHFDDFDSKTKKGTKYFKIAGSSDGLGLTKKPVIGDDGRSITLEYTEPYADWEIAYDLPSLPAHVVAKRAGMTEEELVKLIQDSPKGDVKAPKVNEKLKKAADVWNNDWNTDGLPADKELYLSSGPFIIKAVTPKQDLTLVRNDNYGGTKAKLDEVTVRYISEASAAVTALRNGEADIIAPQASADTLQQLEALKKDGVKVLTGKDMSYDHIDLTFDGVFKEKNVREAFLHCVPRAEIVDKVVGPLDKEAKPLDSQIFLATEADYAESVAGNTSSTFAKVDVAKAKELLGGKKPKVKIMYNKANPNRLDTFTMIRTKCSEAGFEVEDGGLPSNEWGAALGGGTYDATIFGWVSSGVGNGTIPQIFKGAGNSNFNNFKNDRIDQLSADILRAVDPADQKKIKLEVDKILFEERYGLPLFQSIGVTAHRDTITNLQYQPAMGGVWWNLEALDLK